MTRIDHHRLRELFESVMDLPANQRAAIIDAACIGNSSLRHEIESLLKHHDAEVPLFADEQAGIGMKVARELAFAAGDAPLPESIGRYRVVRELGAGGMGIVYEAEQERPVRRKVALKVIKLGMDTREVVARFRQERQALAMLDHPNIAKVLDAGATETGRPYFVMELCAGERITDYCDSRGLTIPARLDLFIQVCQAIQHAHQKALIHRDIKPSNVLVTTQDDRPLAKVIDFGIAKAMGDRLTDVTLHTVDSRMIGTPEYMSPEQADGSRGIDTRTDVYSLGVLLYELLTGCTPFSGENLATASLTNVIRIIREVDPVRPSTRLREVAARTQSAGDAPETAALRTPSVLQGDLDWIVTKALEKSPSRRYDSAGALADDVRRHLSGEPVEAAPPSTLYRFRKFTRRNRGLVLGAGIVALALIVGAIGTLWQASVARREARAARAAERDARRVAEFQAHMLEQIDTALAGDELLSGMQSQFKSGIAKTGLTPDEEEAKLGEFEVQLQQLNPTDLAADLIDKTILRPSIDSIASQFSDQPVVEASLNHALAELYVNIGRHAAARPLVEKALEARMRILGQSHPDTLTSMQALGYVMRLQGDLPRAEALLNETLIKCRTALGPDHPTTLKTQSTIGGILRMKGQLAKAETCWRDVLERRRQVLGPDNPTTIVSMNNLGAVLAEEFKLAEADALYREALERGRRVNGADHPNTLVTEHFLGGLLWRQDRLEEAEALFRDTLEKRRRLLGESHPRTINSILNLGQLLLAMGNVAEAEPLLREAYGKSRRVRGATHSLTIAPLDDLAGLLEGESRWIEAEPLLRERIASLAQNAGEMEPVRINARIRLGRCLIECGRFAEAEAELLSVQSSLGATIPVQSEAGERCVSLLARLYDNWDRAEPRRGYDRKRDHWRAIEYSGVSKAPYVRD
ncbi:MAG: serine/threonine protein kinase [Phycisphaerales bacterium]|nr:serine/threonine protein kinase [Phycisphaerales bacterium]MCB9864286.1 serine/threonine protein kinase [Phycisphaerales bacterium]